MLIAIKREGTLSRLVTGKVGVGLDEVASGVPSLDEKYTFLTDNPEAARTLVSGTLADALQSVSEAWPGQTARVALSGGDGFLLLPINRNLFEIPRIWKAIDYRHHIEPVVRDLLLLLETTALVRDAGVSAERRRVRGETADASLPVAS